MNNLKVGDRIRVIGCAGYHHFAEIGAVGTVRKICSDNIVAVEFDKRSCLFHTCGDSIKSGHGQYISPCDLERVTRLDSWKIVITADGDKTAATLYENGRATISATVQRYHADTYDRFAAADEAVKKLFGRKDEYKPEPEKPKGFTVKAVNKDEFFGFTCGKIYEFHNGRAKDDNGMLRPDPSIKDHQIGGWIDKHFVRVVE